MLLAHLFDLKAITRLHGCQVGWPQLLHPDGYLGLILFYFGGLMRYKHLCLTFGVTTLMCSRVIFYMLRLVAWWLINHLIAQVRFPDPEKMRQFAMMVQLQALIVSDLIGFMDGVFAPAKCTDERIKRNAF